MVRNPRTRKKCSCCHDPCLARYSDFDVVMDPSMLQAVRVAAKQHTNVKGHPYLSKFLCFGLAKKQYADQPGLLDYAFQVLAEDMTALFHDGVIVGGSNRWFGACLGVKADMKFHHQVGHLCRSYYNLGDKRNIPLCHLCMAGSPEFPFESNSERPSWLDSLYMTEPWRDDGVPALATIPFDCLARSAIFRLDLFHCFKMGQGRDLAGSIIVVLCRLGKFDFSDDEGKSIDVRLNRAHSCFKMFCQATGCTAALRSFSKYNLRCPDQSSYPWANCKGSDTQLLCRWLQFFLTTHMISCGG